MVKKVHFDPSTVIFDTSPVNDEASKPPTLPPHENLSNVSRTNEIAKKSLLEKGSRDVEPQNNRAAALSKANYKPIAETYTFANLVKGVFKGLARPLSNDLSFKGLAEDLFCPRFLNWDQHSD
ncbi:MAG: hypothetical protein ACQEP8_02195 [Chlamydiota bacterium]